MKRASGWCAALTLALALGCAGESWDEVNEQAKAASEAGRYEEAAALFERGSTLGDPTQRIMSLNNLGELHRAIGKPSEAVEYYQRAIDLRESELGTSEALANSYANLAMHVRPFDPSRSTELTERALAIYTELFGEGDARVADALNNLGVLSLQQGRLDEAEAYFTRAAETVRLSRGAGHASLAIAHANIAQLQLDRGDLAAAEASYLDALEVWRLTRGNEHPDYARAEANLAELLRRAGRTEEAETRFLRVIELLESRLPEDDPRAADPLNNLALLYKESGRRAQAVELYGRAIARLERAYPNGHPDLAATIFNLGRLQSADGRHAEAAEAYARALPMLDGSGAVETARLVRAAWAETLRAQGKAEEAERLEAAGS